MSIYRSKIADEWLPIPEPALREAGWKEGDVIQLDVVGDAVVLTKVEDGIQIPRVAPKKTRKL